MGPDNTQTAVLNEPTLYQSILAVTSLRQVGRQFPFERSIGLVVVVRKGVAPLSPSFVDSAPDLPDGPYPSPHVFRWAWVNCDAFNLCDGGLGCRLRDCVVDRFGVAPKFPLLAPSVLGLGDR